MNCEIRSLKDRRKNVDTLPPQGKVREVRREWLVHEDSALAYRLQDEEFKHHLSGNKERNVQIREDFPCAKQEQRKEAEEAARLHQMWLRQREEEDARIANEIAIRIEIEESERVREIEERDQALAKHLEEKEMANKIRKKRNHLEAHTPQKQKMLDPINIRLPVFTPNGRDMTESSVDNWNMPIAGPSSGIYDSSLSAINNVGLPLEDNLIKPLRSCRVHEEDIRDGEESPSPPPMSEDEARKLQEEKDAELARRLQEEEEDAIDPLTRDRLLAIETQDMELARLLQEKERVRLKRAKERARLRAAAKRAAELQQTEEQQGETSIATAARVKPRYPDPDEIVSLPEHVDNIATMIDPTYPKNANSPKRNLAVTPEPESPTDVAAPPYMPIQGQRRFNEKKAKSRDGCKQQ